MKNIFAPGCALMIYKPQLAEKIHNLLNEHIGLMDRLDICCRHQPLLEADTQVINICPGCDRRYRNYDSASKRHTTISLWEVLAKNGFFPFPDYHGQPMTILDACPTQSQTQVHQAIRALLHQMNIQLIEPAKTGIQGTCCGDSFWGILSPGDVKEKMRERSVDSSFETTILP
jgi:Fe-S oxidoreductase